ncbi:Dot/Icm T4SS effector alpha/beta hydrolase [Legionella cardiaca]|uniref:SdbB protein (Substrate of the Dot/Icm system) n=1 Tax=Legionella cardiaca TaxID=1071983 RepID=A0ABY8AWP9_9GAMM|nr:Dot/Icm T4SS effector alpha/beta hydrolase [Legionella cardiaca]WED44169.1 hypothetical protein PXX05_05110 [Legionella cardiaca]
MTIIATNKEMQESSSIHKKLQRIMASVLCPTLKRDWYAYKGYKTFDQYAHSMFSKEAIKGDLLKKGWDNIKAERNFVECMDVRGNSCQLDSISLSPIKGDKSLPGAGKHILNFLGSMQFYEGFVSSMAKQQVLSGATVHAFNYPGMYSSTGEVLEFNDLVNSGIAMVNKLLEKGVHPDDIILQGNCLGAAVAEAVAAQFRAQNIQLRVINSNSFKSIKSVIVEKFHLSLIKNLVEKLLSYTGWLITPSKLRGEEHHSPYHLVLSRSGDKTIPARSQMASSTKKHTTEESFDTYNDDFQQKLAPHLEMKYENDLLPKEQRDAYDQLQKVLGGQIIKDPHLAPQHTMYSATDNNVSFYTVVNTYLQVSEKYIAAHRQIISEGDIPRAPFILTAQDQPTHYIEEQKLLSIANILEALNEEYYEEEPEKKLERLEDTMGSFIKNSFKLYQQITDKPLMGTDSKEYSNLDLKIARLQQSAGENIILTLSAILEEADSSQIKPNSYAQFVVDLLINHLKPQGLEEKTHANQEDFTFVVEKLKEMGNLLKDDSDEKKEGEGDKALP